MKDQDQTHQIPESLFKKFGFSTLTEIQKKASPIILQKKDCLVIAPTGSGKTECATIPIFSLLKNSKNFGKIAITVISGYGVGADTAARIL